MTARQTIDLEKEAMDTMGIHMVEGMNMVKERQSKERLEVEGMGTEVEHSPK
jgi:hypothetical protein